MSRGNERAFKKEYRGSAKAITSLLLSSQQSLTAFFVAWRIISRPLLRIQFANYHRLFICWKLLSKSALEALINPSENP